MNTSHLFNERDFQMNLSQFEADLFVRYNFQPKFSPTQVVKCFQFTFSPYLGKSGRKKNREISCVRENLFVSCRTSCQIWRLRKHQPQPISNGVLKECERERCEKKECSQKGAGLRTCGDLGQ